MLTKIIMPSGGQTTNESLISNWCKKIGDPVKRGDVLFEIETDKANLEVESYGEGILLTTYFNKGDYVTAGEIVAYIGNKGEQPPEIDKTESSENPPIHEEDEYQPIMKKNVEEQSGQSVVKSTALSAQLTLDMKHSAKSDIESTDFPAVRYETSNILASPAARLLTRNKKVKIEEVAGTISSQVVKRNDVDNFLKKADTTHKEDCYYLNTTYMRKVITTRMMNSISKAPHFAVSMEINMTQAVELRQLLNEYLKKDGVKISFNDIIMKCVSNVIDKYPLINGIYGEDRIKISKDVNFGLAVGRDNGLVVPVARMTNRKSILEIAKENTENILKAKNGKLMSSDMMGGTITLSNLGMYGVDNFTAIINQPESCIIAAGQVAERAISISGQIVSRQMMTLTASFDHRLIDGAYGAAFLKEVKVLMENPRLLLV